VGKEREERKARGGESPKSFGEDGERVLERKLFASTKKPRLLHL
jgi:hypothetical protein